MDNSRSRLPQSLSRENSWSNEPSLATTDTSQRSRVSDVMTSEPEPMKGDRDARLQNDSGPSLSNIEHTAGVIERVSDGGPMSNTGSLAERKSSNATVDDDGVRKPLSSDVKSLKSPTPVKVIEPLAAAETAVSDGNDIAGGHRNGVFDERTASDVVNGGTSLLDAVNSKLNAASGAETAISNTVEGQRGGEVFSEETVINEGCLDKSCLLDVVDSKYEENVNESDSEATPKNDRSVQEDDISVHLSEDRASSASTLSSRTGVKVSPVHSEYQPPETEPYNIAISASTVEPHVQQASPKHATVTDVVCLEDRSEDLKKSLGSCTEIVSHSAGLQPDVKQATSPGSRPTSSSSSRHSASGASMDGAGGGGKTPVIQSNHSDHGGGSGIATVVGHSDAAESVSSRSIDSVSSKVRSAADGDRSRSIRADSSSNDSNSFSRDVSSKAESVPSGSARSSVSSRTLTVDSEDSVKDRSIHSSSGTSLPASLHHQANVALPNDAIHWTDCEVEQRADAATAVDTDDDVTDLEPDQSLHAPIPMEEVLEIVDKVPGAPVTQAEEKKQRAKPTEKVLEIMDKDSDGPTRQAEGKLEARLDAESTSIEDEQLPEELDAATDSDFNEGGHGSVRSATDAARNAWEEPQSDTSVESRSGRKSDELHRIISKAAAAVESFVTEDVSVKIDPVRLPADRCRKVSHRCCVFHIIRTLHLIDFIYSAFLILSNETLRHYCSSERGFTDFQISFICNLMYSDFLQF